MNTTLKAMISRWWVFRARKTKPIWTIRGDWLSKPNRYIIFRSSYGRRICMYSTRPRTLMPICFCSREQGRTRLRLSKMFFAVLKLCGLEFIVSAPQTDMLSINFLKCVHPRSECITVIIFKNLLPIAGFMWSTEIFKVQREAFCVDNCNSEESLG